GVFINQQLLCFDIPPPGVEIPPLPEPLPNQTNRQRIDAITGPGTCGQGCHATYINPLGYAFENYDPIGRYRTTDNGIAIDASGTYELDGAEVAFANAQELAELLANSEAAHRCYASHWLSYLDGRLTDAGDDAILDEVSSVSKNENLSFQDVIRRLVQ